ncbi:RNA methyltransferase [Nocardioides currus]|uniref:RNA methyltransferase n=1 Tax=Nocardioides currus TaxID=2133958 RepID=A0A2R7YUL1_9ACTN|nr:RNA methyltransferase [Nocardioides currus]PUA79579.1 RNA methyltransferase [Nocardioides currus]
MSRRSVRTERRLFLADGPKAVEGALGVPDCVVEVFATPAASRAYADVLASARLVTLVDDRAMASLSDSVSPAGVVALCRHLDVPLEEAVSAAAGQPRLLVICADVRDPGNAGTVIRTADAAGAAGVVLAGQSVDLYNPKTVRASVGSAFHLPIAIESDAAAAVDAARAAGYTVLAADGSGELDLFDAELAGPTAWLFGNEAWGLPDELAALADHRVAIPIHGRAESLNLSTATAVCLYASAQAQRAARGSVGTARDAGAH